MELAGALGTTQMTSNSDSKYFWQQAQLLIADIILALPQPTLVQVLDILERGIAGLEGIAQSSKSERLLEFVAALRSGNNNMGTTVSEARNFLAVVSDETVASKTCRSDFEFAALENRPALLILGIPEESVRRLQSLHNLFITHLIQTILTTCQSRGGPLRRPFLFLLDEFAALGRLADLEVRANTLRKRRVSFVACVQTHSQLRTVYTDASDPLLSAFNNHLYIAPLADSDAQFVSEKSGISTFSSIVTGEGKNVTSIHPIDRRLLLPSEVGRGRHPKLGPQCTFFLDSVGLPPFQGFLPPIYERRSMKPCLQPMPRETWLNLCHDGPDELTTPTESLPLPLFLAIPNLLPSDTTKAVSLLNSLVQAWTVKRDELFSAFDRPTDSDRDQFLAELLAGGLEFDKATRPAQSFWKSFETCNRSNRRGVLRFALELAFRKVTIEQIFHTYIASGTENVQSILFYADFDRLRRAKVPT